VIKKVVKKNKVLVAMSGGVDSSVVAYLLKKRGYEVIGVFMKLGVDQGSAESAARRVAQKLGISIYPVNVAPAFKKNVINYFLDEYAQGKTPNPCINCNHFIKFGELFKLANELSCDFLATGHYVKNQKSKKSKKQIIYKLLKAEDGNKDQSYFLYNLTQEQLAKILFPLGDYAKVEIKKIAAKAGLPNQKNESQDICFLAGDHNDFLRGKLNLKTGPIILEGEGEKKNIGVHQGLPLYTIGQRRGVEIGGSGPYYVLRSDYQNNILYVTKDHDDAKFYLDNFSVKDVNWVSGDMPKLPLNCEVIIRYRHKPVECVVTGRQKNTLYVRLKNKERAITPGQSAVFYKKNMILGGGIIT
jgi:tRNA-specific 2-thiouridylase